MGSSYDHKIPHDMKIRIVLLLLIWTASYFFVAKECDKMIAEKNFSFLVRNGSRQGRVLFFFFSPLFALWLLWIHLKFALIELYVRLPYFGKKNDLSKEDLEKMVDEYLKDKDNGRQ